MMCKLSIRGSLERFVFICFLLGLPFFQFGHGQNEGGQGDLITVELSFVSWGRPVPEPLYLRSGGEFLPVRVHNMQRSKLLEYNGPNPVVVYRKRATEDTTSNPEMAYAPVGSVHISASLKQPLLFMVPHEGRYRITAMEDSFDKYPLGSYRFFNYTDERLMARFGDSVIRLEPMRTAFLEKPFTSDSEYGVVFVLRDGENVKPLYRNKWRHLERMRYLILISESGTRDTSPIEFRILGDYPLESSE